MSPELDTHTKKHVSAQKTAGERASAIPEKRGRTERRKDQDGDQQLSQEATLEEEEF